MCHVRHINSVNIHPERITKKIKKLLMSLIMIVLIFLCKKEFDKIEVKNKICVNGFGYEDRLVFPIRVSDKKV